METINKLLKKQAPKTNARRKDMDGGGGNSGNGNGDGGENEGWRPNVAYVRYVSRKEGNVVGVPAEFVDAPVGAVFRGNGGGRLIEEVN